MKILKLDKDDGQFGVMLGKDITSQKLLRRIEGLFDNISYLNSPDEISQLNFIISSFEAGTQVPVKTLHFISQQQANTLAFRDLAQRPMLPENITDKKFKEILSYAVNNFRFSGNRMFCRFKQKGSILIELKNETFIRTIQKDISQNGAYVLSTEPIPTGTQLKVKLFGDHEEEEDIPATFTTRWQDPQVTSQLVYGLGCEMIDMEQKSISHYLSRLFTR